MNDGVKIIMKELMSIKVNRWMNKEVNNDDYYKNNYERVKE